LPEQYIRPNKWAPPLVTIHQHLVKDCKVCIAIAIIKDWQQQNHLIELNSNELLAQRLAYIYQNPVKFGFVDTPEAYLYSSARDYAGQKRLLPITLIE
jgi:hypothetical protein